MKTKTPEHAAALAEHVADFRAKVAELRSADRSGEVLMFPLNGLCVRYLDACKVGVVNPMGATDISASRNPPTVTNGNGERAERVTRGAAIDWNVAELERLIAWMEADD